MPRSRRAGFDPPVGDRPHQHVGELLHQLREQAGVKQYEVARDIGINASYVSRIERGSRPASDRVLRYYAERFGAPDLIAQLTELAREAEWERARRRDPVLISKQARYPLPGDGATFVSEEPPDGVTIPFGSIFARIWTIRNSGTVPWRGRRLRRIGPTTGPLGPDLGTPHPDPGC